MRDGVPNRPRWHLVAGALAPAVDVLVRSGHRVDEIARAAGIDTAALADDTRRLPTASTDRIWAAAEQAYGGAFPLRVAEAVTPSSFGHLTYLLAAAPTVRAALRCLEQRYALIGNATAHRSDRSASRVAVDIDLRGAPRPACVESFAVAVVACFLARQTRGAVVPRRVHLRRTRPSDALVDAHRRSFGCDVRFGSDRCGLELDRNALDQPLVGGDAALFRLLDAHAELVTNRGGDDGVVTAVRDCISALGVRVGVRPSEVAGSIGLGERTLRRRLALQSSSFQAELDALLHARAEQLLRDASVEHVAAELGYADPAAFRRAFRRWSGATPRAASASPDTPDARG